jgi:hypothetical protein
MGARGTDGWMDGRTDGSQWKGIELSTGANFSLALSLKKKVKHEFKGTQ